MLILFPKRKGAKIATTIIFQEMKNIKKGNSHNYFFVLGMLYFAAKFGAITHKEQIALTEYLNEKMGWREQKPLTNMSMSPEGAEADISGLQVQGIHTP